MHDLEQLRKEAAFPLAAGNILIPIRAFAEALKTATYLEKRCLYAVLHNIVKRYRPFMTAREHNTCRELLGACTEIDSLETERRSLLAQLGTLSPLSRDGHPGRVNILFVGEQPFHGQLFGAVHALEVSAQPWGGDIKLLLHSAAWATLYGGFHPGCQAALDFLLAQGLPQLEGAILLNSYKIQGSFPSLRAPVNGESLGLGAAMAVLSSLLDVSIPADVAFTGRVDLQGNLYRVDGIPAKLEAARDKGITQVFLPAANSSMVPAWTCGVLEVRPMATLQKVAEAVFDSTAMAEGVVRLKGVPIPAEARIRQWRSAQPVLPEAKRVLLTAVGKSDPIGTWKNRRGEGFEKQDGPILTVCRELRPDVVYLFYTTEEAGKENDYTTKAGEVKAFLLSEYPTGGIDVKQVPLEAVRDPTDLSQLIPTFQGCVSKILGSHPTDSVFVNATSGTTQMAITWHLLTERRLLPARLLQIREARYAKHGKPRVWSVVIP